LKVQVVAKVCGRTQEAGYLRFLSPRWGFGDFFWLVRGFRGVTHGFMISPAPGLKDKSVVW